MLLHWTRRQEQQGPRTQDGSSLASTRSRARAILGEVSGYRVPPPASVHLRPARHLCSVLTAAAVPRVRRPMKGQTARASPTAERVPPNEEGDPHTCCSWTDKRTRCSVKSAGPERTDTVGSTYRRALESSRKEGGRGWGRAWEVSVSRGQCQVGKMRKPQRRMG